MLVLVVLDCDPGRISEAHPVGKSLHDSDLRLAGDFIFCGDADNCVKDLALDIRPAGRHGLELRLEFPLGATGHVSRDDSAARLLLSGSRRLNTLLPLFVIVPFMMISSVIVTVPELWLPFGGVRCPLRLFRAGTIPFHFTAFIQGLVNFAFPFFLLLSRPLLFTGL